MPSLFFRRKRTKQEDTSTGSHASMVSLGVDAPCDKGQTEQDEHIASHVLIVHRRNNIRSTRSTCSSLKLTVACFLVFAVGSILITNTSIVEHAMSVTTETSLVLGRTNETFWTATKAISNGMEVQTQHNTSFNVENMCYEIQARKMTRSKPDLLFNVTLKSCSLLFGKTRGTGNLVTQMVAARLATFAEGRTALLYDCGDAIEVRRNMVLPWISGYFPAAHTMKEAPLNMVIPNNYCLPSEKKPERRHPNGYNKMPLRYMIPLVQHELRRMAVALVGVPSQKHPSADFEKQFLLPEARQPPFTPTPATKAIYRLPIHGLYENGPLFPDVQLDDVVIHFRCGDILVAGAPLDFYFVRYEEYTKLISPEARSIGIVTQAFSQGDHVQARRFDRLETSGERCKTLVFGLIEYIQSYLPKAIISVHNGPNETVALAYARLVMANQTLALFPSTFSVFPAVASFGTGYFPKPSEQVDASGYWLKDERAKGLYEDALVEVDFSTKLYANKMLTMWENGTDAILEWFRK